MKQTSLRSIAATAVVVAGSCAFAQTGNMAVNNDGRKPHPSAILDVSSNYLPLATAEQKGMLIPRVTTAQRNAIAPTVAQQGIMVYQTDGVPGFYYFEYGQWVRVDVGADGWDVSGNNPTLVANEFLGTRDNTDFVFRTNNVEAMRVKGTNGARYVGIGTTTPAEMVDVNGALLINNPSPGSWPPPTSFAATNQTGTILFRPPGTGSPGDTLFSTYIPGAPQNRDAIMWAGHWGNVDGTGVQNLAAADANSGGWRKLENDYQERFTKSYAQPGTPSCGSGSVQIPGNIAIVAANLTSALASPGVREWVSPYPHNTSGRIRHQHMYLASELNLEVNQLSGNANVTGGLCANQPITSIGFYIGTGGGSKTVPLNSMAITIKHVAFGVNDLSTGFDLSNDPAQSCYIQTVNTNRPSITGAWEVFSPLSQPFVWDGVRNIVVEIAYATTTIAAAQPPVLFGPSPGGALLTASWNSTSTIAPCSNAGLPGSCSATLPSVPAGMPWNNASCGTLGTNGGTTQFRPVIQFTGTVATAPALVNSFGSYLYYQGGFVAESTTTGNPFGRQTNPYFAFKGPGTITAENGVFDNSIRLNDHVFDRAFDGQVAPEDAALFGTQRNHSIEEMAEFTRMNRHLPTVKGRDAWRIEGGFSFGDLTNQLWTTTETQALYVTELHDRLNLLEVLSTDRPLVPDEFDLARQQLAGAKSYTDGEKGLLLEGLRNRVVTTQHH